MSEKGQPESERFVLIGDYAPPDAKRLLDALRSAHIAFEIQCDDGTCYYPPENASVARIRIFVERGRIDDAQKQQTKVFGEWRP